MEPLGPLVSKSLVLIRPRSRLGNAAAAVVMLLQLLFVGLMPAADARALAADMSTSAGVHMEQAGVRHHAHDAEDCAFCITMQLGAVPAAPGEAPEAGKARRVAPSRERVESHTPFLISSEVARAPPAA